VHSRVKQSLRIEKGKVEFYESAADAPDQCTAGSRHEDCACREYRKYTEDEITRYMSLWNHMRKTHGARAMEYRNKWTLGYIEAMHDVEHRTKRLRHKVSDVYRE
jgi:hypothetical protein